MMELLHTGQFYKKILKLEVSTRWMSFILPINCVEALREKILTENCAINFSVIF